MKKNITKICQFLISPILMITLVWLGFPINTVKAAPVDKKNSDFLSKGQTASHNKFALLVGIENYNKGSKETNHDWRNLHTKAIVRTVFDKQSKHLFKLMVTNQKTYRGCFVYQSNFRRLKRHSQAAT